MYANSTCIACVLNMQEKKIRKYEDERKKNEYLHEVLGILYEQGMYKTAPSLVYEIDKIYEKYFGDEDKVDFGPIKSKYNQYMLSKESVITDMINQAEDKIKACIQYVCAGNFIDFGAMNVVDDTMLESLIEKAQMEDVNDTELEAFKKDLAESSRLLYITDNCGEVVLDKIFIRIIKEMFPNLEVTAMVRGGEILNDATRDDAEEVGLTEEVKVIDSGVPIPGTSVADLSAEAKGAMDAADVIISKGQGNFESLQCEGYNPYYMFLCKCEMFTRKFKLERFKSVFGKENRIL